VWAVVFEITGAHTVSDPSLSHCHSIQVKKRRKDSEDDGEEGNEGTDGGHNEGLK
jgi:hypothetical protein